MAPASDNSLRKFPRSIQFQGHTVSISVSRSLHSKTEQRNARQPHDLLKQQPRRAKQRRRKVKQQIQALRKRADDIDVTIRPGALELVASDVHLDNGDVSSSGCEHAHEADVVPSSLGKKREFGPGSDSEPATHFEYRGGFTLVVLAW